MTIMKLSLNWVCDFVKVNSDITEKEIVERINLSVCSIKGFEKTGTHLKNVMVAEVINISHHPNAEKYAVIEVNCGKSTRKIVCCDSNLKVGDKIPFVPAGVSLPGNLKITKEIIKGVESDGILCTEKDLNFSDNYQGLMFLPSNAQNGLSLDLIYDDQVDVILEIDKQKIKHRPDLWCHYGFARELGAMYNLAVKKNTVYFESLKGSGERLIDVDVKVPNLVPRFSGISIKNLKVRHSRPFIRHRLARIGLRPINNIVDLTNYVMMEYGQPLHAFDADRIKRRKLYVRMGNDGEKVMTLQNKEAALSTKDMTICDADGPLVVAGVVGGESSCITEKSTSIFLEVANFDPVNTYETSRRIGIDTEASQRMENTIDPELTMLAIQKAVELLKDTNPNLRLCGDPVDIWGKKNRPIAIRISFEFICKRLGKQIPEKEIIEILNRLEFKIIERESEILVEVPSHRRTKDISIPEDLVEEVGRIYGFNEIEPQEPLFTVKKTEINKGHQLRASTRMALLNSGFNEIYTKPLTNPDSEKFYGIDSTNAMRLVNPVNEHQVQMRTSLLPHFVQQIKRKQMINPDFSMFELGRIYYRKQDGEIEEPYQLILGHSSEKSQLGHAFYQLKSHVYNLLIRLQINDIMWKPLDGDRLNYQHKHISAAIFTNVHFMGAIFSFSPEYMDLLGLKKDVCIAELDFNKMLEIEKKEYSYKEPSKYPAVNFEISVIVPKRTFYQDIGNLVQSSDERVAGVSYLDVYYPKENPDKKSVSIKIEFKSTGKTPASEDTLKIKDNIITRLARAGFHLR